MPTISLPDPLYAAAEQVAVRAGFKDTNDYVADLVRRDVEQFSRQNADDHLRRAMAGDGDPATVSEEALQQRKGEIETLLIQGLESGPATPMTAEDWAGIRRELEERRQQRKAP